MSLAVATPPQNSPLSPAHHDEIAAAELRAAKIRKTAAVANFNGWATAVLAVCSAPFALFSWLGLLVTVGMSLVAYNEFRGRRRLLQFDPKAALLLGRNQVGFLALIVFYCVCSIYTNLYGSESLEAQLAAEPELSQVLGSVEGLDQMVSSMVLVFYGLVIALSVVFQGLNAVYYFSRRKLVEAYLQETPQWVLDLQRITA